MDITILLNITCILGSIQFNTTEYYIQYTSILQYYSILHAYWVVFNSILLNITYNITHNITQYYMSNHTILLNITHDPYWVVFNAIFLNNQWIC